VRRKRKKYWLSSRARVTPTVEKNSSVPWFGSQQSACSKRPSNGSRQKCSGTATYAGDGSFRVELRGTLAPGLYTVLTALYLGDNYVNPDIHMVPYRATR